MKYSDLDQSRIARPADEAAVVFQGQLQSQGHVVSRIELKRFVERVDDAKGDYSLLVVELTTDAGIIEMKYDEGFRGSDALASALRLLTQFTGLSSLINRALIELERRPT